MFKNIKILESSDEINIQIDHNGQLTNKLKEYLTNMMYKTNKKALIHYRLNTNIRKWFVDPDKFTNFTFTSPYIERERDYNGIVDLISPIQIKDTPFTKAFNKCPTWGKMTFELSPDYRRMKDKKIRRKENFKKHIKIPSIIALFTIIIGWLLNYLIGAK